MASAALLPRRAKVALQRTLAEIGFPFNRRNAHCFDARHSIPRNLHLHWRRPLITELAVRSRSVGEIFAPKTEPNT